MGLYADHILPRAIERICGSRDIAAQRARVVPLAAGRVLEVGLGAGHNLAFYDPRRVERLWGLEPSAALRRRAAARVAAAPFEVRLLEQPGEAVPLEDASIDSVVLTFTLCSIDDWHGALAEMRRVLRPGGRLLFCEHGTSPDAAVRRWQERLNPVWTRLAGGCRLNRPMPRLIEQGGFRITALEQGYGPGTVRLTRFAGYQFWGCAEVR